MEGSTWSMRAQRLWMASTGEADFFLMAWRRSVAESSWRCIRGCVGWAGVWEWGCWERFWVVVGAGGVGWRTGWMGVLVVGVRLRGVGVLFDDFGDKEETAGLFGGRGEGVGFGEAGQGDVGARNVEDGVGVGCGLDGVHVEFGNLADVVEDA